MSDIQMSLNKTILIQEVVFLRNRLREQGADLDTLTDEAISSSSWKQLREWKSDFAALLRTLGGSKSRT
jgi:hypothetical protein